jgi:peptidoglycan/LPS O-acetylase OafA/YrhL
LIALARRRTIEAVRQLGYQPALDGVRGLAIAPVVLLHAFNWPRDGSLGVDLFFVLSGFLITSLLLEERAATGTIDVRGFWRRRAARLLPGLFVMLAVVLVVTRGRAADAALFAATYTTNIAHLLDSSAGAGAPLGHLWSLAQEEQFYLLWPPVLLFLCRWIPRRLALVLGLLIAAVVVEKTMLVALGADPLRIYAGPDTHADPILVGCLAAALRSTGKLRARYGPVSLAVVLILLLTHTWVFGQSSPLRVLYSFAAVFLILAATEPGAVAWILQMSPLRFLGRISYSLYLWHLPVLSFAGAAAWDGHPARSAAAVPVTVAVATGSYYLVERPLRQRWRQRGDTLAAAVQPA